jgi:2-polyprenyl-6-methoxyphenol hydroxylase-like FAD-dependent oxidoreductase
MKRFDVCVQGEGPVGRALALALARQGLSVASVAHASGLRDPGQHGNQQGTPSGARGSAAPDAAVPSSDVRTYALNAG